VADQEADTHHEVALVEVAMVAEVVEAQADILDEEVQVDDTLVAEVDILQVALVEVVMVIEVNDEEVATATTEQTQHLEVAIQANQEQKRHHILALLLEHEWDIQLARCQSLQSLNQNLNLQKASQEQQLPDHLAPKNQNLQAHQPTNQKDQSSKKYLVNK